MNRDRLSLMTFNIAFDLLLGRMQAKDIFELAQKEGIPYVDLMNVKRKALPKYLSAMREVGTKVSCYIASVSLFSSEEELRTNLQRELKMARELFAQRMMIVPYAGTGNLRQAKRMGRDAVLEAVIKGFRIAVQEGAKFGMPVCFELTPHDELCLSGAEDCLRLLRAVDGLGLVFDTANMLSHGDDPVSAYEALKEYIVHVHLKDVALKDMQRGGVYLERCKDGRVMQCVVWGKGVIPIDELCQRLISDGYSGLFAIEYTHPDSLLSGPDEHHAHLRKFLENCRKRENA